VGRGRYLHAEPSFAVVGVRFAGEVDAVGVVADRRTLLRQYLAHG
jgi:hypothetical protein